MAFMAKILSWHFRHLNIVGCLPKRRPTKGGGGGGSRAPQDPPSYAPEKGQEICTYYCVLLLHVFKVVSYFYLKYIKTLQCFLQVNIS